MLAVADPGAALARRLRSLLAFEGVTIEEVRSRAWASVTFTGARHEFCLRLDGEGAEAAADRLLAQLGSADFPMRGHIVADLALQSQERSPGCIRLRIEALTVEDL